MLSDSPMRLDCYECGEPVELPAETLGWTCSRCGFDQGTQALWTRFALSVRGDARLETLVSTWRCILDIVRDHDTARRTARTLEAVLADTRQRLAIARATFLRTDRPQLAAVREVVRDPTIPGMAWHSLLAAGWVRADDARRFSTAPSKDDLPWLSPFPYETDIAIAFAASGEQIQRAEHHFATLCTLLGRAQSPIWDGRFGKQHSRGSVPGLSLESAPYLRRISVNDAEYAVLASIVCAIPDDVQAAVELLASGAVLARAPNVFDALASLYATGASIEEGHDVLLLRLAPLE